MWKRLRALCALALVPVVLLSTPETAGAAGAWQQTTATTRDPGNGQNVKCVLNLRPDDTGVALDVGGNSACQGGVDYTPGGSQAGEAGEWYVISVSGDNDDGEACAGTLPGFLEQHPSNGTVAVAGKLEAGKLALGGALPCVVREVCITFPDHSDLQACATTVITGPQPQDGACPHGEIHGVELIPQSNPRPGSTSIYDYWWEARVYFDAEGSSNYHLWRVTKQTTASSDHSSVGITMLQSSLLFPFNKQGTTQPGQIEALLQASKPQGLEIYALDGVRNTQGTSSSDPSSLSIPQSYPITYPDGPYRGLTELNQCRWWFGPKIVDFPTTEADEPAGPIDVLNLPPEETEPEVETPPTEWEPVETEPTFWSLVGGLLRLILAAIKALASAVASLVGSLLDGLKALFIPDTASWGVGELRNEMRNKPPFSVASAMYDQAVDFEHSFTSAGDCGVLADFGEVELHCGQIRDVPGMGGLYGLVTAGLIALTGLGIYRTISGVFEAGQ